MLSNLIDPNQIAAFVEEYEKRNQAVIDFWNSERCKQMIQRVVETGEGFISPDILYSPEKIRLKYGWDDCSNDEMMLLLQCLQSESLGDEEFDFDTMDSIFDEDDDPKPDISMLKRGLRIDVNYGQGSFVNVTIFEGDGDE